MALNGDGLCLAEKCDTVSPVEQLVHDWGYEPIMPRNEVQWEQMPMAAHIIVGIYLLAAGLTGTLVCLVGLKAHHQLSKQLMDPSGLMLVNFLLANLGICILLFPFSAISSFHGRWMFGDIGCQAYSIVGFVFGMGSIFGLGLIILDLYLMTYSKTLRSLNPQQRGNVYFGLIAFSWFISFLTTAPPAMGLMGRFYYEPCGTMCTIDYWHGNFRLYNLYIFLLTVLGFIIPIGIMVIFFLRSVQILKKVKLETSPMSKAELEHYLGTAKFCRYSFIVQMLCWTPFAILCLWTTVFEPSTLNIYMTLSAPLLAKFSPVCNAVLLLHFIPRVRLGMNTVLRRIENSNQEDLLVTNVKPIDLALWKKK